uniref:NIDO domain-containing protein n=1 Tax=Ditylenchus dipsaci TaxID=166011 RepID=A0A915DM34_9BILA
MQEELDMVIGDNEDGTKRISLADRVKLPYTNAVINETQRFCNVFPVNLLRRTTKDVECGGFKIAKGTRIVPLISCVLYDEKIFPTPTTNLFYLYKITAKDSDNLPPMEKIVGITVAPMDYKLHYFGTKVNMQLLKTVLVCIILLFIEQARVEGLTSSISPYNIAQDFCFASLFGPGGEILLYGNTEIEGNNHTLIFVGKYQRYGNQIVWDGIISLLGENINVTFQPIVFDHFIVPHSFLTFLRATSIEHGITFIIQANFDPLINCPTHTNPLPSTPTSSPPHGNPNISPLSEAPVSVLGTIAFSGDSLNDNTNITLTGTVSRAGLAYLNGPIIINGAQGKLIILCDIQKSFGNSIAITGTIGIFLDEGTSLMGAVALSGTIDNHGAFQVHDDIVLVGFLKTQLMPDVGDLELFGDDTMSAPIKVPSTFEFFNSLGPTTGCPTMGPAFGTIKMIAAFWADSDLSATGSTAHLYYRTTTTDTAVLQKASEDISRAFPEEFCGLDIKWALVVTWYNNTFFGYNCPDICDGSADCAPRNTFQAVVATDGLRVFTIMYYQNITWHSDAGGFSCIYNPTCTFVPFHCADTCTGLGGRYANIGFENADGINHFYNPIMCTPDIVDVDMDSNVGVTGVYVYRVDTPEIVPANPHCTNN